MSIEAFPHFLSPNTSAGAIFYAFAFFLVALIASRAVAALFRRIITQDTRQLFDPTVLRFLSQFSQAAIFAFALLFYTHLIPSLHKLGTAWLASVSITSLVIGMAAQQSLGNLIAGISLLLYRPFRVGDIVEISTPKGLERGTVETIGLGYTLLNTEDDRDIVIPNGVIAGQVTINLTRKKREERNPRDGSVA